MSNKLDQRLAALATMSPAQLREEWLSTFDEEAPDVPPSLLCRVLAYRLQEESLGGLSVQAQRMLVIVADGVTPLPEPEIRLKPGSRLLREWNGKLHTVMVDEDGFDFNGQRFASLSHVAREITGAHWSGPRFFGLKRRQPPPSRGAAARG
ncbi:DUF2924 domain-containing protein [Rhizorhabdus dicambivorans]|uniref:DUF2924 domain-containing protein n=1 Tax=Rhizorhabdus dicambivorans TaxID=1850238 RepID=A0A2A4FVV8_9SPHN|nr:DUF2924 domain-containing protein [Rhizorhabdus dicambivorans]ATE65517.1 DUF2924 domain-containing protein [Rhizorhabdus dicambivorans]PCE41860.1 DUF2924 domain-containing protein [Rhizorhabdus dicambivorans]